MEASSRSESSASNGKQSSPRRRSPTRGMATPIEDELPREYMRKVFAMPLLERELEREYGIGEYAASGAPTQTIGGD